MAFNAQQSIDFIRSRRSVFPKEFEEGQVSQEEIISLLEAARWAPTHKVTEPWRFRAFFGDAKSTLADVLSDACKARGLGAEEQEMKRSKYQMITQQSAAVVAVIMQRDPRQRVPQFEEEWAVACAVQNIYLHAGSLDIGLYWSTGAERNQPSVREYLDLGEHDLHMGWLFLGRFTGQKSVIKERLTVDEYVSFQSE